VCDFKPNKHENHRVRLTVGGDRLDYSGDTATSTADITTFKILINSTLSTKDAKMMMMDIKHYYLGTPLPIYEYMLDTLGSQRLGLHVNSQGSVRFETIRPLGNPTVTEKVETFWLLSSKTHARPMVAQYKIYGIQLSGR
jgi:hypothetical protein